VRCKKGVSLDELDEPFTCPVNQIDAEDEKRNLWNCAKEHLSQDEYAILLFRYQDNMTLAEIAERTGKNENSVRVKLHRARRKLRVFL
jgi:RNA polymerase sigma factor (sigma-70 family)